MLWPGGLGGFHALFLLHLLSLLWRTAQLLNSFGAVINTSPQNRSTKYQSILAAVKARAADMSTRPPNVDWTAVLRRRGR